MTAEARHVGGEKQIPDVVFHRFAAFMGKRGVGLLVFSIPRQRSPRPAWRLAFRFFRWATTERWAGVVTENWQELRCTFGEITLSTDPSSTNAYDAAGRACADAWGITPNSKAALRAVAAYLIADRLSAPSAGADLASMRMIVAHELGDASAAKLDRGVLIAIGQAVTKAAMV